MKPLNFYISTLFLSVFLISFLVSPPAYALDLNPLTAIKGLIEAAVEEVIARKQ